MALICCSPSYLSAQARHVGSKDMQHCRVPKLCHFLRGWLAWSMPGATVGHVAGLLTLHAMRWPQFVVCRVHHKALAAAGAARPDHAANMRIYGKDNIQPADILNGKTPPPSAFRLPGLLGPHRRPARPGGAAREGDPARDAAAETLAPGLLVPGPPPGLHGGAQGLPQVWVWQQQTAASRQRSESCHELIKGCSSTCTSGM